MHYFIFISFLIKILRNVKQNDFFQNEEDPQDHMFFLIFMSAILVNDNFMGTWFSRMPRRLRFQNFIDNVTREISQENSISVILSKLEAYLKVTPRIEDYVREKRRNWTEEEISVWKLAIIYFFNMFIFESLAHPRFLNIQITDELLRQLETELRRYQKYDPEFELMNYFQKRQVKFRDRIKKMMKEHDFQERKNPITSQIGHFRLQRGTILNLCDFCKKGDCTRCRLCNKHECGCCKQCKTPDSCCKLCRLCSSCSQHDHAVCRDKLSCASDILVRFVRKVTAMARKRYLTLKACGDYCYLCKGGEDRMSFTCYGKGVLRCGHHFCESCTMRMINKNDKKYKRTLCPLCITPIGGGYRDIVWTRNYVKLCHPLILTTREFFLARIRISLNFALRLRIRRLVQYDRGITTENCVVCLDKFNNPMILPCGHVFCHQCINRIDRIVPLGPKKCPSCRKDFRIFFNPSKCLIQLIFGTRYERPINIYLGST